MWKQLHWSLLVAPLGLLALAIAIAATWVSYTDGERTRSRATLEAQQRTLAAIRQRVSQSDQEKEVILRYLNGYESLRTRGFVGTEQRVNWLDALRRASREVGAFAVDYQLAQQTPSPLTVDAPAYQVQQSLMKLQLRLLHEEDLLRFFDALAAEDAGLFLVRKCSMSRASTGDFAVRLEPRVNAECELLWLSMSPRAPAGAGP